MADAPEDIGPARILVADDKAFIRNLIQGMLHKCGDIEVVHANSGEEAGALLGQSGKPFDCIIADWNMEPINGMALLRAVRMGTFKNVDRGLPVIMLTGHAETHIVETAVACDVSGYLVKPVSLDKLKTALTNALETPPNIKSVDAYREIKVAAVPKTLKDGPARKSAWVVWNRERAKLWKVDATLDQLRVEAESQIRNQSELLDIRNKRLRPLENLKPGLVLAEDITDEDDNLLLGAGIVLNESLLARLKELAATHDGPVKISVGDPA